MAEAPPPAAGVRAGGVVVAVYLLLTVVYRLAGDVSVLGEVITIWPPFVWCVLLAPRTAMLAVRRRWRALGVAVVAMALFLGATVEWTTLSRGLVGSVTRSVDRATLRVVSWNVAGALPWPDLAAVEPDLCLLQESAAPGVLAGRWVGFQWAEAFDPAALSRFAFRTLPTRSIGPWTPPQVLSLDLPGNRCLVVVNVRLMLPSIVVAAANLEAPSGLGRLHHERVAQFEKLAQLLDDTLRAEGCESALLCGDFNTPGDAASLAPLRRRLRDVWPEAGVGWGATMTADLPVARIDHCWVTPDIEAVRATVRRGSSDHRMLIVDLRLPASP